MKAWLKGGIIGICIPILYALLLAISLLFINNVDAFGLGIFYLAIFPMSLVVFFIIGALIGLIIGKIKSKNKKRK